MSVSKSRSPLDAFAATRLRAVSMLGLAAALFAPVPAAFAATDDATAQSSVNEQSEQADQTVTDTSAGQGRDRPTMRVKLRKESTLEVPGDKSFPESVTAAPDGTLYVSSIPAGALYRIAAGSTKAEPMIAPGGRPGVAGVLFDKARHVLWACIVDLNGGKPSTLEALDPATAKVVASYALPQAGVCADIAAGDKTTLYVTDTMVSRVLRLNLPENSASGGQLSIWSEDPVLAAPAPAPIPLGVNGIAYDPVFHKVYVSKYNSGQLFSLDVGKDGAAGPAQEVVMDQRYPKLDGIRLAAPGMVIGAVNSGPVIAVATFGDRVFTHTLANFDQPSSLTVSPDGIWVSEGQVERLQGTDTTPVNRPFKLRRLGVRD